MIRSVEASSVAELRIRNVPENVRTQLRLMALLEQTSLNALVISILAKAASTAPKLRK